MESIFARTQSPSAPLSLSLKTIYDVSGDRSYDVTRREPNRTGYIALRTREGGGVLVLEGREPLALGPDSLVCFLNAEIDRYYCALDTWSFWWFEFEYGEELALPLNRVLSMGIEPQETQACLCCFRMLERDSPYSTALASIAMSQLYFQWSMRFHEGEAPYSPYRESIYRVINHMRSHLGEPMRIQGGRLHGRPGRAALPADLQGRGRQVAQELLRGASGRRWPRTTSRGPRSRSRR